MNEELLNKREKYYNNIAVKFELLKAMRDREVIFMDRKDNWKCIRGLMIRNLEAIDIFFKEYRFLEKDYNIYVSLAKYKHIPHFNIDLKTRSKETKEWFESKARDEIFYYDIFLDFDCKDKFKFIDMKEEITVLLYHLDKNNICHTIYPSGNNYQILIRNNILQYTEIENVLKQMILCFDLKYLDLKGVGVYNKIRKCQYSLVIDKIVLPLNNNQFKNTKYDDFDSNYVLEKVMLKNRGLIYLNDYGEEENKTNLKKFFKKYLLY